MPHLQIRTEYRGRRFPLKGLRDARLTPFSSSPHILTHTHPPTHTGAWQGVPGRCWKRLVNFGCALRSESQRLNPASVRWEAGPSSGRFSRLRLRPCALKANASEFPHTLSSSSSCVGQTVAGEASQGALWDEPWTSLPGCVTSVAGGPLDTTFRGPSSITHDPSGSLRGVPNPDCVSLDLRAPLNRGPGPLSRGPVRPKTQTALASGRPRG